MYLRSLSCAVALILATASPRAQSADEVLRRVGDRVLRTEVEIGPVDRDRILLETSFGVDRTSGIDAPAIMTESWVRGVTPRVVGRAYYERFRRFSVRTTERIRQP